MIAHTSAIATSGISFPRHCSIFFFLSEEVIQRVCSSFSLTCVLLCLKTNTDLNKYYPGIP